MKKLSAITLLAMIVVMSSCSRVYWGRDYVKSNQTAQTEKREKKEEASLAKKEAEAIEIGQLATTSPSEKMAEQTVVTPVGKKQNTSNTKVEQKQNNQLAAAPAKTAKQAQKANADQSTTLPKSKPLGEKNQLVALILCALVGTLGIHRFYLGYTVIGIVQLLTLGGCGIWTLIDLIMIITGDLKPKNGEYDKTFDDI